MLDYVGYSGEIDEIDACQNRVIQVEPRDDGGLSQTGQADTLLFVSSSNLFVVLLSLGLTAGIKEIGRIVESRAIVRGTRDQQDVVVRRKLGQPIAEICRGDSAAGWEAHLVQTNDARRELFGDAFEAADKGGFATFSVLGWGDVE